MDHDGIMIRKVSQTKTIHSQLYVESKRKNQAYRYRRQTGGCQRWGEHERGEWSQNVQTSSYKTSRGEVIYTRATIVNNIVLYICKESIS